MGMEMEMEQDGLDGDRGWRSFEMGTEIEMGMETEMGGGWVEIEMGMEMGMGMGMGMGIGHEVGDGDGDGSVACMELCKCIEVATAVAISFHCSLLLRFLRLLLCGCHDVVFCLGVLRFRNCISLKVNMEMVMVMAMEIESAIEHANLLALETSS